MKRKKVEKAGQKFECSGRVFTVKSFFGPDGVEYETAKEAQDAHPDKMICIMNQEYDGACDWAVSFLIEENTKK